MPPSIADVVGSFHEETRQGWSFRDGVKAQISRLDRSQSGNEDSDDEGQEYSTDATFDLMIQLQEILVMSLEQQWDIFDDNGLSYKPVLSSENKPPTSPFRRSRSSFYGGGKKSRSPSPSRGNHIFVSELLAVCISVLASVVAEDCRFQTKSPRPFVPPNALQVLTLNIAQVLLHINAHDPRIASQIGLALIPAFSTFNREMYTRLISFFDQGIIRNSLSNLRRLQGLEDTQVVTEVSVNHPLVSIHVDEVTEDNLQGGENPTWTPWTSTGKTLKVQSSNAPAQPMPVYYLSSFVPPLLGCALDNVGLDPSDEKDLQILRFLLRLLQTIVDLKVDAYLDLLQVIAYHTPRARKSAAALLSHFWPQSTGHVFISQPPGSDSSRQSTPLSNPAHEHQFTPWHFRHRHNWFSPGDSSQYDCSVCRKAVHGFGLICPYCTCAVHFDCYDHPGGSANIQYADVSDPHVQKIAMYRFSRIYPESTNFHDTLYSNGRPHRFQIINLFTLSLCAACQQPLWGCSAQALACSSCLLFVHPHCRGDVSLKQCGSTTIASSSLTISFPALRQSCFDRYRNILTLTRQNLATKSYEELSIFRDVLSTQLEILAQGLALRTLVVAQKGKMVDHDRHGIKEFELHHTIRWCEELLNSDSVYASPVLEEYLQENGLLRRDHSMLYTWSSLVYVAASMKSPSTALGPSNSASSDFLNVAQTDPHTDRDAEEISHPFDLVSLSHMRDVLGHEFRIYSDAAAFSLLLHLHQLAFFKVKDESTFSDMLAMQKNKTVSCSFPLPLGLDLSIDVETLVSAIDACLSDTDLYANEFGFLLLTRRMWPDGLMSDYGLKRLARGVFTWIINEDGQLAIILRDYLGKSKPLPGMASSPLHHWPSIHHERPVHSGSVQNSGDYLASRQALLYQYARRWLLALHNQDVDLYAGSMFETCDELADRTDEMAIRNPNNHTATENVSYIPIFYFGVTINNKQHLMHCERVLHRILQLSQAHVLFSVSDSIYLQWLELAHSKGMLEKVRAEPFVSSKPTQHTQDVSLNTLSKLFPRESDYRTTTSMIMSTSGEYLDRSVGLETDPWQIIVTASQASQHNVDRGLSWLNLLSRSGIEVPLDIYRHFITALGTIGNPLPAADLFVKSILASLWLRSLGRHRYQGLLANFHLTLIPDIHRTLQDASMRTVALSIIKNTLASCLLLYGCEREDLRSSRLIEDQLLASLPSRRKLQKEAIPMEPIVIEPAVMKSIELHLKIKSDDVATVIAQFMHTFFASSSSLEIHEVDNIILKNLGAWKLYDVKKPEIHKLRSPVLLRVLSVDPEGFQEILEQRFSDTRTWERRASSATRLFRILQDVCSPNFNIDGRQWKSSIVRLFQTFFSLLWSDQKEEIRLIVKSHCSSLLPAHFEAITRCFDETITRVPFSDRIKLVSFLAQLRIHFPRWRILSWSAALEVLAEYSENDQHLFGESETVSALHPFMSSFNVICALRNVVERILQLQPVRADQISQDSLAEQGCLFVVDVLEKYSKSGLFIGLLKRPLKRETFFALKDALNYPKEPSVTLKDDLLWDTLMRLQETEATSFQTLLNNLQSFVDIIHHERYSADTMSLFGKQITQCAQRMSDGSGTSVDASPLFEIPASLIQFNKPTSKDMLGHLDTLVRIVLMRLRVDSKSITQLLVATASLRRRNQPQDLTSVVNTIIPTTFEILNDGLRLKTRLQASTLQSILEVLTNAQITPGVTPATLHSQLFVSLVDGGFYWLDCYLWSEGQTEQDFHASLAVAKMIFQAMSYDVSVLQRMDDADESRPQLRSMRAWNILAIVALSEKSETFWVTQLFKQLKAFSRTYFNALWPYIKPVGPVSDSATADINQAYLAIKLWSLIAKRSDISHRTGGSVYESVWNELWPPFESIVNVLEEEVQNGVSPIMAGFIASSITDLFLFIRTLRIPLSLQKSAQKTMLKRLQSLVRGDSVLNKINRAIEGLTETPPETPIEALIDQAAKDIVATEKLRLLETWREPMKATGDRRANVEKKTTVDRLNWKEVRLHT
ncbi:Protein kinase C delta type [Leucoagaricus sp. SymC.cos]|nr:Protein kinase C delta type [Leucoagaricus sp. SymC.cos]